MASSCQRTPLYSSLNRADDVMNDAMSLGIHRLWKDRFVRLLDPGRGMRCLDVAGGTGDIAERLLDHGRLRHADRDMRVHVVDINADMLEEGRRRFRRSMYHGGPQVSFAQGNAERLDDVADNSIDLYTIAFGIRNCTHVDRVLTEAHRVLRPGGVFACLEFSRVTNPALAQLYRAYSFGVIPNLGACRDDCATDPPGHIIAGDRDSYQVGPSARSRADIAVSGRVDRALPGPADIC